jgi:hypothetical protein
MIHEKVTPGHDRMCRKWRRAHQDNYRDLVLATAANGRGPIGSRDRSGSRRYFVNLPTH